MYCLFKMAIIRVEDNLIFLSEEYTGNCYRWPPDHDIGPAFSPEGIFTPSYALPKSCLEGWVASQSWGLELPFRQRSFQWDLACLSGNFYHLGFPLGWWYSFSIDRFHTSIVTKHFDVQQWQILYSDIKHCRKLLLLTRDVCIFTNIFLQL